MNQIPNIEEEVAQYYKIRSKSMNITEKQVKDLEQVWFENAPRTRSTTR